MTDEEEAFMVAADFTLYSNPLTKALHRTIPKPTKPAEPKKVTPGADIESTMVKRNSDAQVDKVVMEEAKSGDIIASDMTMYDSPLSGLEREEHDRKEAVKSAATATVTSSSESENAAPAQPLGTAGDAAAAAAAMNKPEINTPPTAQEPKAEIVADGKSSIRSSRSFGSTNHGAAGKVGENESNSANGRHGDGGRARREKRKVERGTTFPGPGQSAD